MKKQTKSKTTVYKLNEFPGEALQTALKRGRKALVTNTRCVSSMQDAGMLDLGKHGEAQVFVSVCMFRDDLLEKSIECGGLTHLLMEKEQDDAAKESFTKLMDLFAPAGYQWSKEQRKYASKFLKIMGW